MSNFSPQITFSTPWRLLSSASALFILCVFIDLSTQKPCSNKLVNEFASNRPSITELLPSHSATGTSYLLMRRPFVTGSGSGVGFWCIWVGGDAGAQWQDTGAVRRRLYQGADADQTGGPQALGGREEGWDEQVTGAAVEGVGWHAECGAVSPALARGNAGF